MIIKNKIIDSELRLVFPSARNLYYDLKKEPVVKKIYAHKKIKKLVYGKLILKIYLD